jgi:hypothetical protein
MPPEVNWPSGTKSGAVREIHDEIEFRKKLLLLRRMRPHSSSAHSLGRTRWRVAKALAFSETSKPPAKTLVTIPYQALKDSRANLSDEIGKVGP